LRHCFVFILFWGGIVFHKNNHRSTKEGKEERASSLRIRNQAHHESHLAYPSNKIRQFELRQTESQLKKTMTAMAEFQPLTHGYVMAIHGNLKANHGLVMFCQGQAVEPWTAAINIQPWLSWSFKTGAYPSA
jgi:hypothetical protein